MSDADKVARNCKHAGEGEHLFNAYRKRLSFAEDWEKLGSIRQVPIAKWIACRHKLTSHAPIDDCLDRLGYEARGKRLLFAAGLKRCIDQAVSKKAR